MALFTMENGMIIRLRDMGCISGWMGGSMRGGGWRTACTGEGCTPGRMGEDMRGSICRIRRKAMASIFG